MEYPEVTKLYKYREFSARTLSMLRNDEIYYSASNLFNDPFDCRGRKDFEFADDNQFLEKMSGIEAVRQSISIAEAGEYLRKVIADGGREAYLAKESALFQKLVLQSFGVCSLSEINDDILMWSHYADGHKGFCLEFSRVPENIFEYAQPVKYPDSDEFPYVDYWNVQKDELIEDIIQIVTTKSRHWSYEKEWRAIDRPSSSDESYKGHVEKLPEDTLSGIIFGVEMPNNDRETIKSIVAGKDVNLYEARIVKNMFRLEIIDCV